MSDKKWNLLQEMMMSKHEEEKEKKVCNES